MVAKLHNKELELQSKQQQLDAYANTSGDMKGRFVFADGCR